MSSEIKPVGSLLSSKTALKIIKLLAKKEMYSAEISSKLNITTCAPIFHIQKLLKLELLQVRKTRVITKNGRNSKTGKHYSWAILYKMKPDFVEIIQCKIAKEFK